MRSSTILNRAVETAATQTKPAYAGFKTFDFPPVRPGGLRFSSREFHSPRLVASSARCQQRELAQQQVEELRSRLEELGVEPDVPEE